jgi:uncharacterized protein YjbI with pentapeptide repeats
MRGAVCVGTNFTNARMEGANMQGVDLRMAVMDYSQMAGVNLSSSGFGKMLHQHAEVKKPEKDRGLER